MARYALAARCTLILTGLGLLAACGSGTAINGTVSIAAGEKTGDVATVNGEVKVGDGATVGSAVTVNGGVTLGDNVTAQSVKTVNGEIQLGESTKVTGSVLTVNGGLVIGKSADIGGKLANVNGSIHLNSAHVGGGISTVNADIDIGSGSRVEGGIHFEKPGLTIEISKDKHLPRIVIGPGATVQGSLTFDREVKLFISDTATVPGPIEGATAEKFSGDQPTG